MRQRRLRTLLVTFAVGGLTALEGAVSPGGAQTAEGLEPTDVLPASPPLASIGQPRPWGFSLGGGVTGDRGLAGPFGPRLSLAAERDLLNPVAGILSFRGALWGARPADRFDAGIRATAESPLLMLYSGIDWSARTGFDLVLGTRFPLAPGGLLGRGDELRLEYLPGRRHAVGLAFSLPLGQPLAGRTRPRERPTGLLPHPPAADPAPAGVEDDASRVLNGVSRALSDVSESATRLVMIANLFAHSGPPPRNHAQGVDAWRSTLVGLRTEVEAWQGEARQGESGRSPGYAALVEHYHAALDRAFGLAVGADPVRAVEEGRPLADEARRIGLDMVVLPYNRTIGRYKDPDTLEGLAAAARARWLAWLALDAELPSNVGGPPSEETVRSAGEVFDRWLEVLEAARHETSRLATDAREQWLPMALVLRPEQHATQAQVDAILERAIGRDFQGGNAVLPINGAQFQVELERSIAETESFHILWLHDYRGRDDDGAMDRNGFRTTVAYLRALVGGVRDYDRTGRLPVFMILLDQLFYEENDGRLWMTLLERPLTARIALPGDRGEEERALAALQDSLRIAVEESTRLRAEGVSFGTGHVERRVGVQVSIIYPSDVSFRSRRLLPFPPGGDNLMREHRKLLVRDVREGDPGVGEVIVTGAGVGEKYAASDWDDNGLILQGPAAAVALAEARQVLAEHGIPDNALPAALRRQEASRAPASELAASDLATSDLATSDVERLEAAGATARVLQLHNRTGWGRKDVSLALMLLYDLAPPGSVLHVPDSSWTGSVWMDRLVNAALRGCHVLVVAPAAANDPSVGFPWHAMVQLLFTRLVVVEEVFGDAIRSEGGDLRIGLYDRQVPLTDRAHTLRELERSLERHPFLEDLLPFPEGMWEALGPRGEDREAEAGEVWLATEHAVPPGEHASLPVQLHRKTHWIISRDLLRSLASSPGVGELLTAAAGGLDRMTHEPEKGRLVDQRRLEGMRRVVDLHDDLAPALPGGVAYFSSGSTNMSIRSMALDGDVTVLVAGPWALASFFDLVFFTSGVNWIESMEELNALYPPPGFLQRRIGWWTRMTL